VDAVRCVVVAHRVQELTHGTCVAHALRPGTCCIPVRSLAARHARCIGHGTHSCGVGSQTAGHALALCRCSELVRPSACRTRRARCLRGLSLAGGVCSLDAELAVGGTHGVGPAAHATRVADVWRCCAQRLRNQNIHVSLLNK
jgi:hypothetical protein